MKREELFGEKVIELRILEFKSGSNLYGIDIKDIREIMPYDGDCTSIPNSHPYIEGMIMPRDFIIPIVNVTKALNISDDYVDNNTTDDVYDEDDTYDEVDEFDVLKGVNMLVVTSIKQQNIGLYVNRVEGIQKITNRDIREAGANLTTPNTEAVLGIYESNGREVEIIDFRKIFSEINPNINF